MKKVVELIFLSILLLFIGSCGKNTNQNDLEKLNLKGDVVLIKDGEKGFSSTIFFNDKGNIIKEYFDYNGNSYIKNYFYIDDKLSKTIKISNEKNFINGVYYHNVYEENFNYDNNGILNSMVGQGDNSKVSNTYYFYENGKLIKDSTKEVFGFIATTVQNFEYNGESLVRREKNQKVFGNKSMFDKGKIDASFKYVYSIENGLDTKEISDEGDAFSYEYENDLKGNWTKQKKSNGEVWKREIFYKGDDISLHENKFEELKKELSSSSSETNNNQDPTSNNEVVPEEKNIQSNNTPQQQEKRKCYSCNGTGQCPKCSKPQRVRYKQGESPSDHNEIRLGMIVCTQCGGNLMNWGADKNKSCYLCKASGWLYCPECNSSGNGSYIGKCKRCKGSGFDN